MNKPVEDIEWHREMLKQVLLRIAYVPDDAITAFVNLFSLKVYRKKSIIIAPNNTHLKGYFISDGLIRMYYIKNNKEITEDFRGTHSFFLNGYTQFAKMPNFDYFVALEPTTCLEIDWNELEEILGKYHSLEHLGRRVIELHYAESMRVSYNSLFLSVEERYRIFLREKGTLVNKVSLKHIASYLGISQETLSRLRAKLKQPIDEKRNNRY
ncbi:MAG: Crp/Fnr family transcriptional regulator [Chitinophagales bacterium]